MHRPRVRNEQIHLFTLEHRRASGRLKYFLKSATSKRSFRKRTGSSCAAPCTQMRIASQRPAGYGALMSRLVFLSIAIVLSLLPVVRCSADRAGDPIVAEKRPDYYAINYPELQARIEIAHRPLIEVNDAARR